MINDDSVSRETTGLEGEVIEVNPLDCLFDGVNVGDVIPQIIIQTPSREIVGKLAYLTTCALTDFETGADLYRFLQSNFGAGDYRLHVVKKGVQGLIKNERVIIGGAKKDVGSLDGVSPSKNQDIMSVMLEGFRMIAEKLVTAKPADVDDVEDRVMARMEKYKGLLGTSQAGGDMAAIRQSIDFLKMMGMEVSPKGGATDNSFFESLLDKAGPLIDALSNKAAAAGAGNVTGRLNHQVVKSEGATVSAESMQIKYGLGILLRGAAAGGDPGDYAGMVTTQVPGDYIEKYLLAPAYLSFLASFDDRVYQFKDWFDELIEHVKARLGKESLFSDLYLDDEGANNKGEQEIISELGVDGGGGKLVGDASKQRGGGDKSDRKPNVQNRKGVQKPAGHKTARVKPDSRSSS